MANSTTLFPVHRRSTHLGGSPAPVFLEYQREPFMIEHDTPTVSGTAELKTGEKLKQALYAFAAPYLEHKLVQDGKLSCRTECLSTFAELKKYLWLCSVTVEPLVMTSRQVDEVWHQF